MRVVIFCHSIRSDWNHGNAHFLRGIATELQARRHTVSIFEPRNGWSAAQLAAEHGRGALQRYRTTYPRLRSICYRPERLRLDVILDRADVVLVHEWNDAALVARIGAHRARRGNYRLFFHDTHHRAVTDASAMAAYDLSGYDGVLAYGRAIRDVYLRRGWARRAFVWHEAADVRVFRPLPRRAATTDLVWIGNWGDGERTEELHRFMIDPVRRLKLRAAIYGVRYPDAGRRTLARAGIAYRGWLPNFRVPEVFARARVTVHVHRRPYAQALPGIPTIRVFEALACGIPLICSPWKDCERLFTPGKDFLVAATGADMERHLRAVLDDPALAAGLAAHGRRTVLARHSCAHRVDELLAICRRVDERRAEEAA